VSQVVLLRIEDQHIKLSSEDALRRAIERRHLTRETRVLIERDGRDDFVGEAAQDPVLVALLDELDPRPIEVAEEQAPSVAEAEPESEAIVPKLSSPTPKTPARRAKDTERDSIIMAPTQAERPDTEEASTITLEGRTASKEGPKSPWPWVIGSISLIAAIIFLASQLGGDQSTPRGGETTRVGNALGTVEPGEAIQPARPLPTVQMFAIQDVPVLIETRETSARSGDLRRGDPVDGRRVGDWFEILEAGTLRGYVPMARLSNTPPAELTGTRGFKTVRQRADARAAPDRSARIVARLSVNDRVDVVGTTEDGWEEIIASNGNIAFVSSTAFEAPEPQPNTVTPSREPTSPARAPVTGPIMRPEFTDRPSQSAMNSVHPAKAAPGVRYSVVIECRVGSNGYLYDCVVVSQSHIGSGMAETAMALMHQFRLAPLDRNGDLTEGRKLSLPFNFYLPP
jgi:hypothetical protein